jgi:hypothetical protein
MDITDDTYIIKLKQGQVPDHIIAARLGISVNEVRRRWDALVKVSGASRSTGMTDLWQICVNSSEQIKLLGSSLWMITTALGNPATPEEVSIAIQSCPEGTDLAVHLLSKFIVLRAYVPPPPEAMMEEVEGLAKAGGLAGD